MLTRSQDNIHNMFSIEIADACGNKVCHYVDHIRAKERTMMMLLKALSLMTLIGII